MKHSRCIPFAWAALALAFPISALADLSDTKTLSANTGLNLDTGAFTSSGNGDILWNGNTLTPQGNAKAANVGPAGGLTGLSKSVLDGFKLLASSAAIPSSTLVVGDVFVVFTNGGNTSGVLVTANSGSSITLQFTTFGVSGGSGGGPTISRVSNNSSDIPSGFPNSGITQGALFKIVGSGLAEDGDASLHDSQASGGLPTTLNGASVTVTSNGTTLVIPLYYATPAQIDGVMPANMPLSSSATLTVTHNGTASFTVQVVAAAPGLTTYNNGTVVAQDNARPTEFLGGLVTFTKSAPLGGVLIIWGSGFGATSDSDTAYTGAPHQTDVPYTVYIGGVQANVSYKGRTVYPGVSVFAVTVPQNAPQGCYVPMVAVASVNGNSIVSNTATLPIHAGGGPCSDPQLGYDGNQVSTLTGKSTVKNGVVFVGQTTSPGAGGSPTTSSAASAVFSSVTGTNYAGGNTVSIGGCIVLQSVSGGPTTTSTGLNAGTITVTGPNLSATALSTLSGFPGFYSAVIPAIPSTGGAYAFNGGGGPDVGGFTANVTLPNPLLTWDNQSVAATVSRSGGLTVSWSGGTSGSYVTITGSSLNSGATGTYTCIAPQADGHFFVPSYILLSLPAGTGTTSVANTTNFSTFNANSLDFGRAFGSVTISVNSSYN